MDSISAIKNRNSIFKISVVITAVVLALSLATTIGAQDTAQIEVDPAAVEVEAEPGEAKEVTISVTDTSGVGGTLAVVFNDGTATTEATEEDDTDETTGTAIASWMSGDSEVVLNGDEATEYTATVTVPEGTAAGDYNGSISFESRTAEDGVGEVQQVSAETTVSVDVTDPDDDSSNLGVIIAGVVVVVVLVVIFGKMMGKKDDSSSEDQS